MRSASRRCIRSTALATRRYLKRSHQMPNVIIVRDICAHIWIVAENMDGQWTTVASFEIYRDAYEHMRMCEKFSHDLPRHVPNGGPVR
jgi:hypothetical protein